MIKFRRQTQNFERTVKTVPKESVQKTAILSRTAIPPRNLTQLMRTLFALTVHLNSLTIKLFMNSLKTKKD